MSEPNFELLFPTPVMFAELGRAFTKTELDFVTKNSKKIYINTGNTTSLDNYILDAKEFSSIKKIIQKYIESYVAKVYKPKFNVKPYITQSWLNWTKPGEYHHTHEHPNSFISGVLYVHADPQEDKIKFHKSGYQQIVLESDNYDILNSKSWWFNVGTGSMVIFPSSLTHNVDQVTSGETRISLAFNTFLKGTIGDNKSLTELKNE
jgi:uncharacterized protein (TIGR02466 family)